ncbi:zinc finger protein 808-like isoform X1 [Drosophila grimshawi]|uniref:zinc finger protein 808-like isoform X1 n=1 Tax=Drosophila grimshawi TaxID=7222 RepID=UPI000C86F045|nr:zinc finger protein 808-like isoform X1 [Drosophila grimshawi]
MEAEMCRICLNDTVTLVEIFARREQTHKANPEPSLAEMLNECADCHIKFNDSLPQQICLNCVLSAQNAFRFKRKCEQSYQQLRANREERQKRAAIKTPTKKVPSKKELLDVLDIKQEHEIKVEPASSETPLYKCAYCSKTFDHLSILSLHKKWHAENHHGKRVVGPKLSKMESKSKICSICNKKCKTISLLRKHLCSHSDARPFACTQCPTSFQFNSHLKRHMRGHTGERPYQCPFCPQTFARSDYCRGHMDKTHSGLTFTGKLINKSKKNSSH